MCLGDSLHWEYLQSAQSNLKVVKHTCLSEEIEKNEERKSSSVVLTSSTFSPNISCSLSPCLKNPQLSEWDVECVQGKVENERKIHFVAHSKLCSPAMFIMVK